MGAKINCVHGDEHVYPTAEACLTVGGQTYLLQLAVVPSLPFSVILGNDIPTHFDLIHQSDGDLQVFTDVDTQGSVAESQRRAELLKPSHVVTRTQRAKAGLEELPFFRESLETKPGKTRKS